jgi:four helix bundle protein
LGVRHLSAIGEWKTDMQDFKKLVVWQKSHQLTVAIYQATKNFPAEERYGLVSQIRRSCASVPTNIAEGCGRGSNRELAHFSQVAMGSASELEYQLLLARDLRYLTPESYQELNDRLLEVKRMLYAFIQKLKKS